MKKINILILSLLCIVNFALSLFAKQIEDKRQFNEIIAFGDSLTDVGNVAELTEPGFAPLIFGYYGKTHFSDNLIWIEVLANYWGLSARIPGRGVSTTLQPNVFGNTWAWGGSKAANGAVKSNGVTEPIPNLLITIDQYLASNKPNRQTLYALWSGADSFIIGDKFGPNAAKMAANAVGKAIVRLDGAGARHILVFNMPRLGDTPGAQAGGKAIIMSANTYTFFYNKELMRALKEVVGNKDFKANIYLVDVYSEFERIVNTVKHGEDYMPNFFVPGSAVVINNVSDQGLHYFQIEGLKPQNYLFWDALHPTYEGHQVLAALVIQSLQPLKIKDLQKKRPK